MTNNRDRIQLRRTFDSAAEAYDRVRPGYPSELFEDLASRSGLRPGSRVLEIGCGTGQATVPLAERGYRVVAVELGAELAAIARSNLARFANVEVVVASFEDWPSPPSVFDAIVSASAFHWIDPAIRVTKAAQLLRTRGSLAIIETRHQPAGSDQLFAGLHRCYERWSATTQPRFRPFAPTDVPESSYEIEQSSSFAAVATRTYDWEQTYSTIEYLELLATYSDVHALEPATRSGLLACIGRFIDDALGGEIRERYRNQLLVARKGTNTSAPILAGAQRS